MAKFLNLVWYIFLLLVNPIQSCLDPNEQSHKCTSCISSQFLRSGKCYEKQKGCLEHEVKGEDLIQIICTICQSGYVPFEKKCQRKALAELRLGQSISKLNQPAPVIIDKLSKLSQMNITDSGKFLSESKREKKIQKYFPQIVTQENEHNRKNKFRQKQQKIDSAIVSQYPFLQNLQSIKLLSPKAVDDTQKYFLFYPEGTILMVENIPKQLKNIRNAVEKSKNDFETKIVLIGRQASIFSQVSNLFQLADLETVSLSLNILGKSQDGKTIDLNLGFGRELRSFKGAANEKQQQMLVNKVKSESEKRKEYEKYFKLAYAQFLGSMPILNIPDIVDRIKIERQKGNDTQNRITFNISFLVDKDSDKEEAIIRYNIEKNATQIVGYYIDGANILSFFKNTSQINGNINMTQNSSNDFMLQGEKRNETEKINKSYQNSNLTVTKQSVEVYPNKTQNKTEGNSIREITQETKGSSEVHKQLENNKSQPTSQPTSQEKEKQAEASKNQLLRVQANQKISNSTNIQVKTNETFSNNKTVTVIENKTTVNAFVKNLTEQPQVKNQQTKVDPSKTPNIRKQVQDTSIIDPVNKSISTNLSQSQSKQAKNESSSKTLILGVKSWSQLLPILRSKQSEIAKATTNYKLISFTNQTDKEKSEVAYLITLFTQRGILFIRVLENQRSKQIQVSYTANNSQKCIDLANETIITKLDSVLKKSYPFLAAYNKNGTQYMLDSFGEKYILIYSNEQVKKLFYEVSKSKESTKYVVSKSGVFDNGYCFEKKDMQNINLKISDFEQDSSSDKYLTNIKNVRPIINQLILRFKPFVSSSIIASALSNSTHIKIYLSNRFVTFEFTKKLDELEGSQLKGNLTIVQEKYGYDYWPVGAKKQYILKQPSQLYEKIEEAVLKKYKFYFSNGTCQMYIKRSQNQSYEVVFKNLFGYFLLSVELNEDGCKLGSLKKTADFDDLKFMFCKPTEHWQIQDKRCFRKVTGCYKQIGGICIACQLGLNLSQDMKKCSKMCF